MNDIRTIHPFIGKKQTSINPFQVNSKSTKVRIDLEEKMEFHWYSLS